MKHLFAALMLLSWQVHATEWLDGPELGKLFSEAGVQGTFVLYDVDADRLIGHNRLRAETRFIPASTFKIVNSLVGLSVGVVSSVDEALPFGGQPQMIKDWERDMGLREAIKMSNVPIYQELARRIGHAQMRDGVTAMGYGNAEIGDKVDRFWLDGPLKISAVEQTAFLARLARDQLPLSGDVQAKVREIVMLEQSGERTLYGKTGWLNAPNPGIGWWVGWVTNGQHAYSFALNIDITQAADAPKRVEIGRACLKALGIF
ncbi:Class D beta-lactamase (EC 3.5.2.6) [Methylomonas albis]|uniref:Beta-lactamase n=1 Tax=Methylomonas albis TaxID=1854563 RepID=A0ABR9D9D5_9GAMM|nr:class D beta-lactamase [Methylomonas albis]MBD9358824.1 class D beta-lactamase [Methylomonas albis]CAD6882288.1 Class D beta-lactamase (EC 3.5.2.6) [Methylomonas albis]